MVSPIQCVEFPDVAPFNIFIVIFRHLMVNPKERKVVVVESLMTPTLFRDTVAKVLFKHFEVKFIFLGIDFLILHGVDK